MEAILRLCNKAILLKDGSVIEQGGVNSTVASYLGSGFSQAETVDLQSLERTMVVRGQLRLKAVRMTSSKSYAPWKLPFGNRISFEVEVEAKSEVEEVDLGVALMSARGFEVASCLSSHSLPKPKMSAGQYKYTVEYPTLRLVTGLYKFGLGIQSNFGLEDYVPDAFEVEILSSEASASYGVDTFRGAIVPDTSFALARVENKSS